MFFALRIWYHTNKAHDAYERVEKLRCQKKYFTTDPTHADVRLLVESRITEALASMEAHNARVGILRAQQELNRRS